MSIETKGFKELVALLKDYGPKIAKPAIRKAVRAGGTILKAAVKAEVNVEHGDLKKAQDVVVRNRGYRFTAVVGADVAKLQEKHGQDHTYPTNIDHLVEFGHMNPDGSFTPPSGYMRRAATAMPAAQAKAESVLKAAIENLERGE